MLDLNRLCVLREKPLLRDPKCRMIYTEITQSPSDTSPGAGTLRLYALGDA